MARKNKKVKKKHQDGDVIGEKNSARAVKLPPKFIFEEKLRTFLAVILFLLFLLLFASVAWYLLTQLDSTFVNGTGFTSLKTYLSFF